MDPPSFKHHKMNIVELGQECHPKLKICVGFAIWIQKNYSNQVHVQKSPYFASCPCAYHVQNSEKEAKAVLSKLQPVLSNLASILQVNR